jgi:hypothetical protein
LASRYIAFATHLDAYYVQLHSNIVKSYVSKKAKTNYNLKRVTEGVVYFLKMTSELNAIFEGTELHILHINKISPVFFMTCLQWCYVL